MTRAKQVLSRLGLRTYTKFQYSGFVEQFTTEFNPVWEMIRKGTWEQECLNLLSSHVKQGDTILDVGAWVGPYAIFLSSLVMTQGKVVAFEPDPVARQVLIRNLQRNNISNVMVESVCISNKSGFEELAAHSFGHSGSSIIRNDDSNIKISRVEAITLDEYCSDKNIMPAGIKIDVEGAESKVLDGMQRILKNAPWILLEFHGDFMNDKDRVEAWNKITRNAKRVLYVDGNDGQISKGKDLTNIEKEQIPVGRFRVFVSY